MFTFRGEQCSAGGGGGGARTDVALEGREKRKKENAFCVEKTVVEVSLNVRRRGRREEEEEGEDEG